MQMTVIYIALELDIIKEKLCKDFKLAADCFFENYMKVTFYSLHHSSKTSHEKVRTLLHASKASIGCVIITHTEHKNNAPFLHVSVVFCE